MTDLHSDLQPYVYMDKDLSVLVLKHPLIFSLPYIVQCNDYYNKSYLSKLKLLKEYILENKWSKAVNLHEKPYKVNFIFDFNNKIDSLEYWKLLKDVWVSTEFPSEKYDLWETLFNLDKPNKHLFMSENDQDIFNKLPDNVVIHRGYQGKEFERGVSYTLDYSVAEFFQKRFNKRGKIRSILINKKDIFAYVNDRQEKEIIYLKDL